jgi:hypothetical protein
MHSQAVKVSAVALSLALGLASPAADAAMAQSLNKVRLVETGAATHGQAKVIQLGTIHVTRADMERVATPQRGSTAYLGTIQVTRQDTAEARLAERHAQGSGRVFLGTVEVTAEDSPDARFAANQADQSGSFYVGSIEVTQKDAKSPVISGLVAVRRFLGTAATLAMISTLVFARAWG